MLGNWMIGRGLRKTLQDEDGTALLEMAISLTATFLLAFALFELCMLTYTCIVLNDAAQEGVRYAIMHGTDSSNCSGPDNGCADKTYANVKKIVTKTASASLHDLSAMTVNVTYGSVTATPGNPVSVKVVYTYVPYMNFPGLKRTMTFTSQGRVLF
ncbi:TadE/TadG family type IV pilus assembly protein [Edaphobacter paludis]|uniref:TadE/TadG family type IV pilus assembly protein n=1 Tax=Edaphobacter paludis TaxID=3035702 RepID=A0AAU7D1C1_9BACT